MFCFVFFCFFFWGGGGGRVGGRIGGVRVDVNEEMMFLRKFTKKIGGGVGGVQCSKLKKKKFFFFLGGAVLGQGGVGLGGQGGCERRIEVFEKMHKKIRGGGSEGRGSGGGPGWWAGSG